MKKLHRFLCGVVALACTASVVQAQQLDGQASALASEQSPSHELRPDLIAPQYTAQAVTGDTFAYIDFSDGLNGWTFVRTNPDSVLLWEYELNPDLSADNGDTRYEDFNSPTVDNGFMWLDYRKYLIDIGYVIGSPPYPQLVQTAISPVLDLSALDLSESYALGFYSYQSTLNIRNCRVEIRDLRGTVSDQVIWTTLDEIARPNTISPAQEFANIPSDFYGLDSVQFLFVYDADFYGWAVDDIYITQRPRSDGAITDFYARAPNVSTPATEASAYPLAFVADVMNNGGADQAMRLAVTIENLSDEVLFTDTLEYAPIMSDSLEENRVFPSSFPMPTQLGVYEGRYDLITTLPEADITPDDNSVSFLFEVTDGLYSRSGNENDGGVRPSADNEEYGSSNLYLTPSLVNGDTVMITEVSFRAVPRDFTDNDEGFLELKVYGWRGDLNGDGAPSFDDDPSDPDVELVELSLIEFTVDATWGDSTIVAAPTEDGDPIMLPLDEDYIGFAVALDYFPQSGGTNDDNRFFTGQVDFSGGAYTLATDSLGAPIYLSTLRVPDNPTLTYGYFTNRTPFLDARINVPGVSSTKSLPAGALRLSPNPTDTRLFMDVTLSEASNGMTQLRVINSLGQPVIEQRLPVVGERRLELSTADLSPGMYYLLLKTADGRRAMRPFVKR